MDTTMLLDYLLSVLQRDSILNGQIKRWFKTNAFVPGSGTGCSVSCRKIDFEEYTREQDRASVELELYFFTQQAEPADGEAGAAQLALRARRLLCQDYTFGGLAASSSVKQLEVVHGGSATDMQAVVLRMQVVFYLARLAEATAPPIAKI